MALGNVLCVFYVLDRALAIRFKYILDDAWRIALPTSVVPPECVGGGRGERMPGDVQARLLYDEGTLCRIDRRSLVQRLYIPFLCGSMI